VQRNKIAAEAKPPAKGNCRIATAIKAVRRSKIAAAAKPPVRGNFRIATAIEAARHSKIAAAAKPPVRGNCRIKTAIRPAENRPSASRRSGIGAAMRRPANLRKTSAGTRSGALKSAGSIRIAPTKGDELRRAQRRQVIALQTEFIQAQMKEFAEQAKELGETASKIAMKSVQPPKS
jgi:hypothetical protein